MDATTKSPPSPTSSPMDVLINLGPSPVPKIAEQDAAEKNRLEDENAALKRELAALRTENEALRKSREEEDPSLALIRDLLDPLERLEKLALFEEARCAESPMLPALYANVSRFHRAFGEHGVATVGEVGETFSSELHELAKIRTKKGGRRDDAPCPQQQPLLVTECHLLGLRHTASATVLRKALVVARPKAEEAAPEHPPCAAPPVAAADGPSDAPRVHELQPSDTLHSRGCRLQLKLESLWE